jgi:aminomethyltransferase
MSEGLRKTPLHAEHLALGAKMVPFAGYEMPVQYPTGITAEHRLVRESVGLFDVSHMGEVEVRGPEALELVQRLTVNDASALTVGQAQYSALCRQSGGIIDDLLVYRFPGHYMLVINASNRAKDVAWMEEHARDFDADLTDRSDDVALLALQGPGTTRILAPLVDQDLETIGYYRFAEGRVAGAAALVSRTGYTGEDGFELYVGAGDAARLWRELLDRGGDDVGPAGLGARDSLRLEMGYALYGNDLDEDHTPLESGLGWIVKLQKGDFLGRDVLVRQKEAGVSRKLVGFRLVERGFPRPGYPLTDGETAVGAVTSGVLSPSLGFGVGMGYVPSALAGAGTEIGVQIRNRTIPAVVQRPPFYTDGSIKR